MKKIILSIVALAMCAGLSAQSHRPITIDGFYDGIHHWDFQYNIPTGYPRLEADDYVGIADRLILWQNADGGWAKNIDWLGLFDIDSVKQIIAGNNPPRMNSTLDNRNIYPQIEFLAQVYKMTGDKKYKEACERGFGFLFDYQSFSGGWRGWDVDAVTYNDEVTNGAMDLMMDVLYGDELYAWASKDMKKRCQIAFDRALAVTIKCQVVLDGKKTIWGQQHDHKTLLPCKARTYELPSLATWESGELVKVLMRIKNPSPELQACITAAYEWFDKNKIMGMKVINTTDTEEIFVTTGERVDRVVVKDPSYTAPYWTRFYDLENQRSFFCNRDGRVVYSLPEVQHERRMGYDWYVTSPVEVLQMYPAWKKRIAKEANGGKTKKS